MMYWNEMLSKWGFADGEATPPFVELHRRAYVLAVNALAKSLGSERRAVAYDRNGMHNSVLILIMDARELEARGWDDDQLAKGTSELGGLEEKPADAVFHRAVDLARYASLDSFVVIDAELDEDALRLEMADPGWTRRLLEDAGPVEETAQSPSHC